MMRQKSKHEPPSEYNEPDDFPWNDAARWKPDNQTAESVQDQFDLLFSQIPAETIGSVEHMGWFGLLTLEGQAGGIILSQNAYGSRHAWATASDEALTQQWEQLQREHNAFSAATRPHQTQSRETNRQSNNGGNDDQRQPHEQLHHLEAATTELTEREDTPSGHYPEIWVGSLSDYNNGQLHGAWLDATLDPEALHNAIQFILRHSYYPGAEEWAIMDYDDFCGLNLGEYESLAVASRIAQGIAEHGEAFAKWVGYVGERSEELLTDERFRDHYLGHFESTEDYAENLLEETDGYSFEEYVPEWLKSYVKVDVEMLGRDMESELYVVEADGGGVFVFDPRG
jgi:antirestriction protein